MRSSSGAAPSPFHFIAVPDAKVRILKDEWTFASYGWGMIPVTAHIGETDYTTSLFPKNGGYLVPVRDVVRDAEAVDDGDVVTVRLTLRLGQAERQQRFSRVSAAPHVTETLRNGREGLAQ